MAPDANGPGAPLFLHIGSHKAGSTTIQGFLRDAESALEKRGVIVPAIGRGPSGAHHRLVRTLREGSPRHDDPMWAEVRRAGAPAGHRLVLSSEGFESLPREAVEGSRHRAEAGFTLSD